MDRELEEQIDDLIHKATKDLKIRILRIVTRGMNKALKDKSRGLKTTGVEITNRKTGRKVENKTISRRTSKKEERYKSDNDSDGYYSD